MGFARRLNKHVSDVNFNIESLTQAFLEQTTTPTDILNKIKSERNYLDLQKVEEEFLNELKTKASPKNYKGEREDPLLSLQTFKDGILLFLSFLLLRKLINESIIKLNSEIESRGNSILNDQLKPHLKNLISLKKEVSAFRKRYFTTGCVSFELAQFDFKNLVKIAQNKVNIIQAQKQATMKDIHYNFPSSYRDLVGTNLQSIDQAIEGYCKVFDDYAKSSCFNFFFHPNRSNKAVARKVSMQLRNLKDNQQEPDKVSKALEIVVKNLNQVRDQKGKDARTSSFIRRSYFVIKELDNRVSQNHKLVDDKKLPLDPECEDILTLCR